MSNRWLVIVVLAAEASLCAAAICPGETKPRPPMDAAKLMLQYDASAVVSEMNLLPFVGSRLKVEPRVLQTAAESTQKLSLYLTGIAVAWNACGLTQAAFNELLLKVAPGMKQDALELGRLRQDVLKNQTVNAQRVTELLRALMVKLETFAKLSGEDDRKLGAILRQGEEIKDMLRLVVPPAQIQGVEAEMAQQMALAREAYTQGYKDLEALNVEAAIGGLEKAYQLMPIPEFALGLGMAYRTMARLPEAEKVLREGLTARVTTKDVSVAARLNRELALVLHLAGQDRESARAYATKALQLAETLDDAMISECSATLGAILLLRFTDLPGAEKELKRSLKLAEAHAGQTIAIAKRKQMLAEVRFHQGDVTTARALLTDAVKGLMSGDPDHPDVARAKADLAVTLARSGDIAGALLSADAAIAIDTRRLGPRHPAVAADRYTKGLVLMYQRDLTAAAKELRLALEIQEGAYGLDHPEVAIFAGYLAGALRDQKDLPGARQQLENALRIHRLTYGDDDPQVATDHNNLAVILRDLKDFPPAEYHARQAIRIEEKRDPASAGTAERKGGLATLLQAKGDLAGALVPAREALVLDRSRGDSMAVAQRAESLAKIFRLSGDQAGEREHREMVIKNVREALGKAAKSGNELQIATLTNSLGVALRDSGDLTGAVAQFETALTIAAKVLSPEHPRLERMRLNRDETRKRMEPAPDSNQP